MKRLKICLLKNYEKIPMSKLTCYLLVVKEIKKIKKEELHI